MNSSVDLWIPRIVDTRVGNVCLRVFKTTQRPCVVCMLLLTVAFGSETKPYFTPGDFLNVTIPHILEPMPLFYQPEDFVREKGWRTRSAYRHCRVLHSAPLCGTWMLYVTQLPFMFILKWPTLQSGVLSCLIPGCRVQHCVRQSILYDHKCRCIFLVKIVKKNLSLNPKSVSHIPFGSCHFYVRGCCCSVMSSS